MARVRLIQRYRTWAFGSMFLILPFVLFLPEPAGHWLMLVQIAFVVGIIIGNAVIEDT